MSLELKIPEAENYFVIPGNSNLRWLMMFYALPRELVEKRASYLKLPRNMRPIMNSEEYWGMIDNDAFLELIWDCYAWAAWQYILVPGKNGEYRPIPGDWRNYSGDFPIWRIAYTLVHHFKQIMEKRTNWTLQRLFDLKKDQELPWLGWGQFSNIVAVMTEIAIEENNLQPVIDETWLHRQNADYDGSSTVRRDFERTWNHSRKSAPISIEDMLENGTVVDGETLYDIPDPRESFENHVASSMQIEQFKGKLTEQDRIILHMRNDGHTMQEIADKVGYKTPSAVKKRIEKIAAAYTDFISAEYSDFLDAHTK